MYFCILSSQSYNPGSFYITGPSNLHKGTESESGPATLSVAPNA